MSQVCFICSKHLNKSETVIVERGITTLINSSVDRNDGHLEYFKDKPSVTIYVQCRKMYTRKSSIATAKRQREMEASTSTTISPPRTRLWSGESFFCFKNCCLFCDDEANEEAEKKTIGK